MNQSNKSLLYAIGAVLCWSTVATMFKIALSCYSLLEVLLIASFTSFVVFALVALFQNKWMHLHHLQRRDWLIAALIGLVNPVAYYLVLFKAYSLLPAHIAQPVNYSWPIILVVLLSVIRHQPISKLKLLGLAISLAGVVAISLGAGNTGDSSISVSGLLIALLSACLWAVYWIINSMIRQVDPIILFMISFFFGTLYLIGLTLFFPIHVGTTQGVLSSIYIGLFEMSIPFIFFGLATRTTNNPVLVNQLCYLSPFLSLFIIHLVLKEHIAFSTFGGLLLIVAGITFNEYGTRRVKSRTK